MDEYPGSELTSPVGVHHGGRGLPPVRRILGARHRAHARGEDRIRHAKDSGLGRFPSREFNINQTWLMITQIAADLTTWTRLLGCIGDAAMLATCEPRELRCRFPHVPARLAHSARRRRLKIPESWPSAAAIVAVLANIAAIRNRLDLACPPPRSPPGELQPGSVSRPVVVPAVTPRTGALDHTAPTRSRPPS